MNQLETFKVCNKLKVAHSETFYTMVYTTEHLYLDVRYIERGSKVHESVSNI